MTTSLRQTPVNQQKIALLQRVLEELLAETLCRGFHGSVGIEFCVQDGTIQNMRRRLERIER